jgi:phosphatidylglycerophosphate synthase
MVLHRIYETPRLQPLLGVVVFTMMAVAVLTMIRNSHPFQRLGSANRVTVARSVLVALAASLIAAPTSSAVAWTLVGATVAVTALDGVDGWLARRSGMASVFGARFDMEVDALFMLILSILVWQHDKAGPWVLGLGALRYMFVAAGWGLTWLARPLRSTLRGKTMAIVALVAQGVALAPIVPRSVSTFVCAAALLALAWSFAVDVRYLWRRA